MIHMDFSGILTIATAITGVIWLIDTIAFKGKRKQRPAATEPKVVEYARSFFPVLLAVLLLRSFVAEPFRIPTGSMKPTLLEGDFILVNKFTYGLRLPITATKLNAGKAPTRGDIMVFRYPKNPKIDFIKRVVGVPGDTIRYENKTLYINGEKVSQDFVAKDFDRGLSGLSFPVDEKIEHLDGKPHAIYVQPQRPSRDTEEVTVPAGMFFVTGDNRDNSEDSRAWGFVAEELIIGKAFFIWMSWDGLNKDIRWKRIGTNIG